MSRSEELEASFGLHPLLLDPHLSRNPRIISLKKLAAPTLPTASLYMPDTASGMETPKVGWLY